MRWHSLFAVAFLCCASGDYVKVYTQEGWESGSQEQQSAFQQFDEANQGTIDGEQTESFWEEEPQPGTVYVMDQGSDGSYRVAGMLENFDAGAQDAQPINQLLERPRVSFFDLSWSNWVEERLQVLDLVQDMLIPRCPHMQPESASFDTGMVSYLASSRFGPAILTTYAQQFREMDDIDFDYDDVHLPEGTPMGKSYEDASLLEDLSANANKAFQTAEMDSRSLAQNDLGFFAASLKADKDLGSYTSQLDGEFESVQPSLRAPANYFANWEGYDDETLSLKESSRAKVGGQMDNSQLGNCFVFVMLLIGCLYVWISLARSCCQTFSEARSRKRELKQTADQQAQKELLAPLLPEKAAAPHLAIAAAETSEGIYYQHQGSEFTRILIPLAK